MRQKMLVKCFLGGYPKSYSFLGLEIEMPISGFAVLDVEKH